MMTISRWSVQSKALGSSFHPLDACPYSYYVKQNQGIVYPFVRQAFRRGQRGRIEITLGFLEKGEDTIENGLKGNHRDTLL